MALVCLIYVSSAVGSFSNSDVLSILNASRVANEKREVTGLLLYKDGNFMQVLEGEAEVVDALHDKISKDPRHSGIITLHRASIEERTFGNWQMGFKDMDNLTEDEKAARSDFLDRPLNDNSYVSTPNEALFLLESFKDTVR